jgi:hypothetical protein
VRLLLCLQEGGFCYDSRVSSTFYGLIRADMITIYFFMIWYNYNSPSPQDKHILWISSSLSLSDIIWKKRGYLTYYWRYVRLIPVEDQL